MALASTSSDIPQDIRRPAATEAIEPALDVDAVGFDAQGGARLLTDVSFQAEAGEIVALVGPNGAGKTTLIRLLAGLTAPHHGEVRVDGRSVRSLRYDERARMIAYVGQSDEPDGRLSIRQYVELGQSIGLARRASAAAEAELDDVLTQLGLAALRDSRLDRVSGGERQKAKVARAICQKPKLLILDEPTNHLDPHARGEMLRVVFRMGVTIVAALHDLTLIDAFAHQVAIIEDGKLVAFAPPEDALSSERVRHVFGVDFYRFTHPKGGPALAALDVMTGAATA